MALADAERERGEPLQLQTTTIQSLLLLPAIFKCHVIHRRSHLEEPSHHTYNSAAIIYVLPRLLHTHIGT